MDGLVFAQAGSAEQIAQVRDLFLDYAKSLGFSLCFQNFDQELATSPGHYAPPEGRLLLAEYEGQIAGCAALRELEAGICEMTSGTAGAPTGRPAKRFALNRERRSHNDAAAEESTAEVISSPPA